MKLNIPVSRIISSIVLLMIVGGFLIFHLLEGQVNLWPPTLAEHQSSKSALWIRKNIYINPNKQTQMVTIDGKLMLVGSDTSNNPSRLVALDELTGTNVWQYGNTNVNTLAVFPWLVYVGEVGRVIALNPDTGETKWSTHLPFTRSVTKLLTLDNILYVDTVSKNHFLLKAKTGEIIQSISYATDDVPIWSDHQMNLEIVGDVMYFQNQLGLPNGEIEIIAIDKLSGTKYWSEIVPVDSRIEANSLGVFVLTLDGRLLRLNPITGAKEELIQFTPAPLQRYYYPERGGTREYGYHVAVDSENQLVFVYLGDSAQLFAFELENSFPQQTISNLVWDGLPSRREGRRSISWVTRLE